MITKKRDITLTIVTIIHYSRTLVSAKILFLSGLYRYSQQFFRVQLSEVAEYFGFYQESYSDLTVEAVVVQQTFAETVVELAVEILVLLSEYAVCEIDGDVGVKIPSFTFDACYPGDESFVVADELCSDLPESAVVDDVFVVHAVDDGNPYLAVHHKVFSYHDVRGEGDAVPRARLNAVATVRFVLDNECHLADIAVFDEERLCKSDTGIEVQVGHRHRVFEHVPEAFLGVEQVEIGAPWQRGVCETLRDGNLKLDVGVVFRRLVVYRWSEDEIVVLVYSEIWLVGKVLQYAVFRERFSVGDKNLRVAYKCGYSNRQGS